MQTTLFIDDLRVPCIMGLSDESRAAPQPVRIDIELRLDGRVPHTHEDLARTWDQRHVAQQVAFVLQAGRFVLMETAARVLTRNLLLPPPAGLRRPLASAATVTLCRPDMLSGSARARVQTTALARNLAFKREVKDWGSVDIVDETRDAGLYRLNIAPGRKIPNHVHRAMFEAELVLTPGLEGWQDDGPTTPVPVGRVVTWEQNQPHGYRAIGPQAGSILCLNRPPFQQHKEVLVQRGGNP